MTISISSTNALSICYTDATEMPECLPAGNGCAIGTRIAGSSGITSQITEDVTLRTKGCADTTTSPVGGTHSLMREASFVVSSTVPDSTEDEFKEWHDEQLHDASPSTGSNTDVKTNMLMYSVSVMM